MKDLEISKDLLFSYLTWIHCPCGIPAALAAQPLLMLTPHELQPCLLQIMLWAPLWAVLQGQKPQAICTGLINAYMILLKAVSNHEASGL